jgi:hypothetical protein
MKYDNDFNNHFLMLGYLTIYWILIHLNKTHSHVYVGLTSNI